MSLPAIEIEQIVQIVIERLRAAARVADKSSSEMNASFQPTNATSLEKHNHELLVTESVVSLAHLRDRLHGVRRLSVTSGAIVTPAVRDLLRSKNIELVRTPSSVSPSAESRKKNSILVCGSTAWMASLSRQIDAQTANLSACEDGEALKQIERHFSVSGRRAVWVAAKPYAAISNFHATVQIPAIHLSNFNELTQALGECRPRLIVVDAKNWTAAAVGNLIRTWTRSH